MDAIRREFRAPGGRTRYPITMRRIKLDAPMAERAMIKTGGFILCSHLPSFNDHSVGFALFLSTFSPERLPNLIKSAGAIRILLGPKTKLDLFASDPRDGQGGDFVFAEESDPGCFHGRPRFASLQTAEYK